MSIKQMKQMSLPQGVSGALSAARRVLTIAAVVLCANSAFAESTQVMLSACKPIARAKISDGNVLLSQDFPAGTCWGAFAVVQQVIWHIDQEKRVIYNVCAPAGSNRTQFIAVFVDYAERNPQRWHEDFFDVALFSLQVAFPCRTGR